MANPKKLSKEQIEHIKHKAGIYRYDTYSEQQLREAVEMETDFSPISWGVVCNYVFYWCNKFSNDFKREVRENYIKELVETKQMTKEEATNKVNEMIAEDIIEFILKGLYYGKSQQERFKMLQQIKKGKFFEFIKVEELIPFSE